MRIILYNIQYLLCLNKGYIDYFKIWKYFRSSNKIAFKLAKELFYYNPDILELIEVDKANFRNKNFDFLNYLENYLNMENIIFLVKYPSTGKLKLLRNLPVLNKQGNALITKKDIENVEFIYLKNGLKRLVIRVKFKKPNINILLIHLSLTKRTRKKQIFF